VELDENEEENRYSNVIFWNVLTGDHFDFHR